MKDNYLIIASVILGGSIIFSTVYYGVNNKEVSQGELTANVAQVDMQNLADNDPVLGNADAPVTIVEFSDFQCPFCQSFWAETFPQIKERYIDTGKVKFVYRDYPLDFHEMAQTFAEAGGCANEQEKFWEMQDAIFGGQQGGATLSLDDVKRFAKNLGVDEGRFNECLDTHKYADEVKKDLSDGTALGINGTPAFFINGKLVVGALPFSMFEKEIEEALK